MDLRGFVSFAALSALSITAHAQHAEPTASGAPAGYELALTGATHGERGHALTLTGVGYEVNGLADLSPRAGLEVDVEITARDGRTRRTYGRAQARTEAGGRFTVAIDLPAEALADSRLELVVHRSGQPGRRFHFPLHTRSDLALDLLTDRNRYQPGEDVRTWLRVRGERNPAPLSGRRVKLTLFDMRGQPLATAEETTGPSGVVHPSLTLPESAEPGPYRVHAELLDAPGVTAQRGVQVWERTVERLLAEISLRGADDDGVALVGPGGTLRGRVVARTPSGTPVRGAHVELRVQPGAQPLTLTTGRDGAAAFEVTAPAFLSGEVSTQTMVARVVHAAHGTLTVQRTYLMARTPVIVSATPRGGALVPEVPSTVYLSVSDPRGRPLREGTEVEVRGPGLRGGSQTARVDAKGFAEVTMTLPRGAAARMNGGSCAGQVATTFEVEVQTDPPRVSRVCAQVSGDAELNAAVVGAPIVDAGAALEVEVTRRPSVRGRPVLIEALFSGRAVAFAWVDGRASRGTLDLPADLVGVVHVRARAARLDNTSEQPDEPGAVAFGVGALDAVIVRPRGAFGLQVAHERERYLVRETARVGLQATAASDPAWAALLVRDEAAHGGEGPWDLRWMSGALHEAAQQPADEVNARLLRASLSGMLSIDPEPPAPAPLEPPYWRSSRHGAYSPGRQMGRGVLRDPVALREEMLRRGLAPIERVLEQAVRAMGPDAADRAPIVSGRGFHPDVIAHLIAARQLSDTYARTLGGEPITVAMIERADPGFSFETVARRVARERLSRLLLALLRLTDPDNRDAQRASANLPPERWLGTLVQLGMVPPSDLVDPWGNAYVFRRVGGRPAIALSERALDWELASPGADGRLGSADDVKDPFARAVPEGTPYAVSSGEEQLMRRFAALAPASHVLTRMSQAYDRLSLAAYEEQQQGPVSSSGSEISDDMVSQQLRALGYADGAAEGGGGSAGSFGGLQAATPAPSRARRRPAADEAMPEEEAAFELDARMSDDEDGDEADSRAQAMGALIREDFPATLFYVGQVPLEGGATTVEVPLADALTTYRLEAIAWTATGWTTSAMGRLSVDQEVLIDAPIPETATAGDVMRLPIRIENRTDAPIQVRLLIEAEGDLQFPTPEPQPTELPANEAREVVAQIRFTGEGEGALVVSVARDEGAPLDAVRRPVRVLADARTARDRRTRLMEGAQTIEIEVPDEASARGPGQLRLTVGAHLFGDPTTGDPLWAGWAFTMAGQGLPEAVEETALQWVSYEDHERERLRDPLRSALALAALWGDDRVNDEDAARALRSVSQRLPAEEAMRTMQPEAFGDEPAWLLLALSPIDAARRPALREDLTRTRRRLRQIASGHAASATDAPLVWARAAAALALDGQDRDRAVEMARRAERHVIRVGDMAWVEPEAERGHEPRAQPTALLALARLALGQRGEALALVRSLVDMQLTAPRPIDVRGDLRGDILPPPWFQGVELALASAAAGRLAPGVSEAEIALDGRPVETTTEGSVTLAVLERLGEPGAHTLTVTLPDGAVALAHLALSYGLPWDAAPHRRAPIALEIEGELGARDTRSGVALRVQNRGPRILTRPIVEIELPAGAELDEPTREALAGYLAGQAHQEGRTLILPLRPLAPAAWVRLPLPVRWSVGGTLRGLGAVVYDALGPDTAEVLPVSVLPSRAVELPDEGPEPDAPDMEQSDDPPSLPPPIPLLERLVPGEG